MSFRQIVWKMAKFHYKKYIFYFLCSSFAVMVFFMFSTLYFNERVIEENSEAIQGALSIPGVALIVFAVFFIGYAHNIFIKRRKSEFGLFMTLGMSNRDISILLLMENAVIGMAAIITGLLGGAIFSKLFFFLIMKGVGIEGIPFHLSGKMIIVSIFSFLIVFSVAVGKSLFQILNEDLISSLKSDKLAEIRKMKNPNIGVFGIAIIIGSVLGLYMTYTDGNGDQYLFLWALFTFIGLYISLYQFTSFLIEIAKKNKPFYYQRLLWLTSLDFKFKKLTSLLMLVTVMIMVTILYSTVMLTSYILAQKDVLEFNPYDIAFIQTETKNNLPQDELHSIVDQKENPIKKHHVIPIFYIYEKQKYSEWEENSYHIYTFMPVADFNKLTSKRVDLEEKEYLYFVNEKPEYASSYEQDWQFPIKNQAKFTYKDTIVGKRINYLKGLDDLYVVSNSEFERLKRTLDGFETNIHLINVVNWKDTASTVEKLSKRLHSFNDSTPPLKDVRVEERSEEYLFEVKSKIEHLQSIKQSDGLLFFIAIFLSVIFFFGSFTLLYLNLFSEIDKEKEKYRQLHKIGITTKEVKRLISREITTLFFVPTGTGALLAFLYIVAMATDIGGVMNNREILLHFLIIAGIYTSIQIGFFLYARRKMFLLITR